MKLYVGFVASMLVVSGVAYGALTQVSSTTSNQPVSETLTSNLAEVPATSKTIVPDSSQPKVQKPKRVWKEVNFDRGTMMKESTIPLSLSSKTLKQLAQKTTEKPAQVAMNKAVQEPTDRQNRLVETIPSKPGTPRSPVAKAQPSPMSTPAPVSTTTLHKDVQLVAIAPTVAPIPEPSQLILPIDAPSFSLTEKTDALLILQTAQQMMEATPEKEIRPGVREFQSNGYILIQDDQTQTITLLQQAETNPTEAEQPRQILKVAQVGGELVVEQTDLTHADVAYFQGMKQQIDRLAQQQPFQEEIARRPWI